MKQKQHTALWQPFLWKCDYNLGGPGFKPQTESLQLKRPFYAQVYPSVKWVLMTY